uniref:Uncharacterized protein n=1 Tax=Phlebotomus papatasi TaxID=29031 RepID=A0A1B0D341_PHLPP
MDTTRIFESETTKYIASEADGITLKTRLWLTIYHSVLFNLSCVSGFLLTVCGIFRMRCSPKSIEGQVVLVTGAANGIGREICLKLCREKCKIIVADINFHEAEKTAEDIRNIGGEARAYKLDVADFEAVKQLREEILKDFGYVDILINNAGLLAILTLSNATPEQIDRVVTVNVTSVVKITKLFLEDMVKMKKGHIVAISAAFGLSPISKTVYGLTMFALRGFMTCLNQEILINGWEDGIKTTCAFPFYTATRKELTDYTESLNL